MNQMKQQRRDVSSVVHGVYRDGIKPCIVEHDDCASIHDPVFHINRNRVVAETLKAVLRLNLETDVALIEKLLRFLLSTQHRDGSWSEIHPCYDQPSALITSIVGETLLVALQKDILSHELTPAVNKARQYVIKNEKKPGYFLKSSFYTADHLNVDATCGAFLAGYADVFNDEPSFQAAVRASTHVIDCQQENGVYPYAVDKGNYSYTQNVPCVHYQGVTLYYLCKIHAFTKDERVKRSLLDGANWLASLQKPSGRFDWSQSGLLFAYYLTGAYAFAFASFRYLSEFDRRFIDQAERCLSVLVDMSHQNSLFPRWEEAGWLSLSRSVFDSVQTAKQAKVGMNQSLFRFSYALYRQLARRWYSETVNETVFNMVVSLLHLNVSTIEPFANYPDLFMSSEIIDCLSSVA